MFKLFLLLSFMQQDYEIINIEDHRLSEFFKEIVAEEEMSSFNSAKIYQLTNNRFLIVPQEIGKYIILYYSKNELEKHIKNKYFPIEDYETDSLYEREKEIVSNIDENIDVFLMHVQNKFDFKNISYKSLSFISHLESLDKRINEYGLEHLSKFDILAIGQYVNEIFRKETKTNWGIDLIFTLNPYWVSFLISEKGDKYDVAGRIYKSIIENSRLDIILSYKMELAKFKGYKPFSEEYLSFISDN